jgi:hypothetical protein
MLSRTYPSSGCWLADSMTRPSQSMFVPYSKRVPGSLLSGAVKISRFPLRTFPVPVTRSQRTRFSLKNQ